MKTSIILHTAVLLLLLSIPLQQLKAKEGFNAEAGLKIIYAKDENILQNYYKPFAVTGWSADYYDVYVSYNRWLSYAVTDELLNTMEINIHQPGIEATLYTGDIVSIDAGYSYFSGDSSYKANRFDGGILIDLEKTDISADFSYKDTTYDFPGEIHNISSSAGAELSFDINSKASWDISYEFSRTDYSTFGYVYRKHTLRTGIVYISSVNLFFMGGLSGSADSADVVSAMFDAGITFRVLDHVKVSGIYMFTADFKETESVVSGGGSGGGTSSTSSTIESDVSHTGSISVSLYY